MDFNKELKTIKLMEQELVKKAEKLGYRLINNELTKDEFISVIEIYARGESTYESYGGFHMFKKIIPLTNEQIDIIKKIKQTPTNLIHDLVYGDIMTEMEGLNLFYEILEWSGELEEENIDRIVDDLEDEYGLEDGQKLYLEFFFNEDKDMDGYISVYDMPIKDFDKQKDIEIFFNKYLTWN